jgi:signal transduction histidine kinase
MRNSPAASTPALTGPAEESAARYAAFLRAVSHELRTPTTALKGVIETLSADMPRDELARCLPRLKRYYARLEGAVEDVSLRKKLLHNEIKLAPLTVALYPLLLEIVRDFSDEWPECRVAIRCDSAFPAVWSDPAWTQYIVVALLRNAAQFMPDEQRRKQIVVEARRPAGWAELRVRDNAPPIAAEYRPLLFDVLPQFPPGGRRPDSGLGLGLYAMREIARQMDGELRLVAPRPSAGGGRPRGNSFCLRLPLTAVSGKARAP